MIKLYTPTQNDLILVTIIDLVTVHDKLVKNSQALGIPIQVW